MSNILSLDLSTKNSGWATKNENGVLHSGVLSNSSTIIEKRIAFMRDEVMKLIKQYNIDTVIVEEVHAEYTHNSTVNQKLNWLQGCIRIAIWEYNKDIKIETLLPNSWRSKIGIKTGAGVTRDVLKRKDIEYVKTKYQKVVGDDEADAIGLYDAYCGGASLVESKKAPEQLEIGF